MHLHYELIEFTNYPIWWYRIYEHLPAAHCINRSADKNVRFFLKSWAYAYLTYLQWPFKVTLFWQLMTTKDPFVKRKNWRCNACSLHRNTTKKITKGSLVVKDRQKNWPWTVTVGRSNKPMPTFQEKSDIHNCRPVNIELSLSSNIIHTFSYCYAINSTIGTLRSAWILTACLIEIDLASFIFALFHFIYYFCVYWNTLSEIFYLLLSSNCVNIS